MLGVSRIGVVAAVAVVAAGCGSEPEAFPPAAGPATAPPQRERPEGRVARDLAHPPFPSRAEAVVARLDGGRRAVLDPRRRTLTVGEERVFAGVGPTHVVAGDDGRLYVTDTYGGAVLYFRTNPRLALVRRAAVPGAPYGTAIDRERGKLWVTLTATNEAVQLTADGAPRIQRRFATVRQPDAIAVDEASGTVFVQGARAVQAFAGYPDRRLAGR